MLDAQKLSSVRPARAVFPHQDSRRRTVEEPVITGSLTMPEQWQAANVCSTHLVYVSVSSRCSIYITCRFIFADTSVLYIVIFKSVENVTNEPNGSRKRRPVTDNSSNRYGSQFSRDNLANFHLSFCEILPLTRG